MSNGETAVELGLTASNETKSGDRTAIRQILGPDQQFVAQAEHDPNARKLSRDQIFHGPEELVIGRLLYYVEQGENLSFEEIKDLYSRISTEKISYELNSRYFYTGPKHIRPEDRAHRKQDWQPLNIDVSTLPHTVKSSKSKLSSAELADLQDPQKLPEDFYHRHYDYDNDHDFSFWLQVAGRNIDDEQKIVLMKMFLDQVKAMPESTIFFDDESVFPVFASLLSSVKNKDMKTSVLKELFDYVITHKDHLGDLDYISSDWSSMMWNFQRSNYDLYIKTILSYEEMTDRVKPLIVSALRLGCFEPGTDLAYFINSMKKARADYERQGDNVALARVDRHIRILLGLEEGEVLHESNNSFYREFNLNQYDRNEQALEQDRGVLQKWLPKGGKRALDLACGTGRLTKIILDQGYEDTHAVDISEENLAAIPADIQEKAKIAKVSWFELADKFGKAQFQTIVCGGRSLHHVGTNHALGLVINNMAYVLEDGGEVIVDFADPTKGIYKQRIERTRQMLVNMGIEERDAKDTWMTISSPDGKNFLDRLVPKREDLIRAFRIRGFKLVEEVKGEIPGLPDDENMYFRFRKVQNNLVSHLTPVQIPKPGQRVLA